MTFKLIDSEGQRYESDTPGTLGGHRGNRVYGRLDCEGAKRWIEKGHYVSQRVFFADEETAVAAGYRPCATCMPGAYARWKARAMLFSEYDSPIGPLLLCGDADALTGLGFKRGRGAPPGWLRDDERFDGERRQLDEYFAGGRTSFDFPMRLEGAQFDRRVWRELEQIPYGTTATYGEIAERIGKPGRARAVGAANGRNPIAIVVPCHRVIGAGGKLTGYGGGLERKRELLVLEGALLPV
jgi:methylated-DNA-[protein]-cysteine S-methyltransferase